MKIIGLTGGIASGKSTVSKMFIESGINVIDADKISREVVEKGKPALTKIIREFGEDILNDDGTLNRKALGKIVFNDRLKLNKLNEMIHPEVIKVIIYEIDCLRNNNQICCVVDAPLLIESGLTKIVDVVILIYIEKEIQLKRLMKRDMINLKEALKRVDSQMPFEEKKRFADYIINNSEDIEYTKKQFNTIIREILFPED